MIHYILMSLYLMCFATLVGGIMAVVIGGLKSF